MERLGYGTLWYGESLAQEAFGRGAMYLAATERLVIASGIANIWARDAAAMANGGRTLGQAARPRIRPAVLGDARIPRRDAQSSVARPRSGDPADRAGRAGAADGGPGRGAHRRGVPVLLDDRSRPRG